MNPSSPYGEVLRNHRFLYFSQASESKTLKIKVICIYYLRFSLHKSSENIKFIIFEVIYFNKTYGLIIFILKIKGMNDYGIYFRVI